MAKKGQNFKSYTKEFKEEVLRRHFEEHIPVMVLAREYGISRETIKNWLVKWKIGETVMQDTTFAHRGIKKSETSEVDYKERYEILKKYQAFLKAQREKK